MSKSPAAMAALLALVGVVVAFFWELVTHLGLAGVAIFEEEYRFSEIPADLAFFSLAAFLFYLVFHRYLTGSARATEALNRSHAELELRVQQRTQALDAERDKLLRILDAMPDGICIINEDYEVEYINPVLQNDWGAVEHRKCYTYFAGRDDPCPGCRNAQIMEGHTLQWEWMAAQAKKTYELVGTPLREIGGKVSTLHVFHDITERKAATEEQARLLGQIDAERQLFQAVIENAPASIALFDGSDLSVKWSNRQYHEHLPPPLRTIDITGLTPQTLYSDASYASIVPIFHQVSSTRQPYVEPEFASFDETYGQTYWHWSLLPLPVPAKDAPDLLLMAHDITAQVLGRKRMEEMSAEAQRRAQELHEAHLNLSLRARELSTLLEISHNMASTLRSRPLLEVILDQLKIMIDCSGAAVFTATDGGITVVAYRGLVPQEAILGIFIPLEHTPGYRAMLEQRTPILIDDLYSDAPLARRYMASMDPQVMRTLGDSRSWLAVPLIANDQVIGMLRLDHLDPGHFTVHDAQIAMAIASQAAIAMENARLYEEARKLATLEERQRMARELHDSVSQALYGIALGTHAAREQLDQAPAKLRDTLDYILALSGTAVSEMRALIFELRPDSLEKEGLVVALSRQADATHARAGVEIHLELCPEPEFALDIKEILFRIAQEALQNIVKHAQARLAKIRLALTGTWVVLEVSDDGVGFDPDSRFPGHLGLQSMRERTLQAGGTIEIESAPRQGTRICVRIPIERESILTGDRGNGNETRAVGKNESIMEV